MSETPSVDALSYRTDASVLCVDIGGTSTKAGLLDPTGQLSSLSSIDTQPDGDCFASSLCGLIQRTLTTATVTPCGIGIAVAGFLDSDRTCLAYNPNLPWLENFPLKQRLAEQFAIPIELEIDSNAACIAEYRFGFNQTPARFLCITAGTGMGVGMTINGNLLRFAHGCMGDPGHIIVDYDGPACSCGGRGCAEAIISAPALAERYRVASLRDVISAAEAGKPAAIEILREAGHALGIAAASLAHIFFPDQIAIAGGLSAAGNLIMEPLQRTFQQVASHHARGQTKISRAFLGPNATLIGAAWPFWQNQKAMPSNTSL
jgi:glucokinase